MTALAAPRWVRAKNGWVAGVSEGLARSLGIETWILRAIWLISFLWFGARLVIYVAMAICLPREDKIDEAMNKKLLGVCRKIALKYDLEVGLVRLLFVLLALSSFGLAILVYIVLAAVLPKEP
jgi:phage shock protein C